MHVRRRLWRHNQSFLHIEAAIPPIQLEEKGLYSIIGEYGTGKTTSAVERTLRLANALPRNSTHTRSVLALYALADKKSPFARSLNDKIDFYSLERNGHTVSNVFSFCRVMLQEFGVDKRLVDSNTLHALFMQNLEQFPMKRLHSGLCSSPFTLKREVYDSLSLFQMLESAGIFPEEYQTYARESCHKSEQEHHVEYAEGYKVYRQILGSKNLSSWSGIILDGLSLLRSNNVSSFLSGYSDIVIDELEEMNPASIKILAALIQQPNIQSTMAFCHGSLDYKHPNDLLLDRLVGTSEVFRNQQILEKNMRSDFSQRIASETACLLLKKVSKSGRPKPLEKLENFKCLEFDSIGDEELYVAQSIKHKLTFCEPAHIVVACSTIADIARIELICEKMSLPIIRSTLRSDKNGYLLHQPGVSQVFSMLQVLEAPSDTHSLYNVLRSDSFDVSPELLSQLLVNAHKMHKSLLTVIREHVSDPETGSLTTAQPLVKLVQMLDTLQPICHQEPTTKVVHQIVRELGLYEGLVTPTSPEDEEMAIAFANVLRAIELAENCVGSPFLPFVVPYMRHLGETRQSDFDVSETNDQSIRILHLPKASISELQSKHLYFVGMSDRKYPGRIRRLGIAPPADLLENVKHSQTRSKFLEERQYTMYNALCMAADSITISFAQNVSNSPEREKPSRILEPIWPSSISQLPAKPPANSDPEALETTTAPKPLDFEPSYQLDHLSFSQIAEYQRCPHRYFLHRVLKLSTDDNPALIYGRALHESIAAFANHLRENPSTTDAARAEAGQSAMAALTRSWVLGSFASETQAALLLEQANADLDQFIGHHYNNPTEILHVEAPFTFQVEEADVNFRGIWDRIDRDEKNEIVIKEYKSNVSRRSRNVALMAKKSLQLQLYVFAYQRVYKSLPDSVELSIIGTKDRALLAVTKDDENEKDMIKLIKETAEQIRKHKFQPTPSFGECMMCPYSRRMCHARV